MLSNVEYAAIHKVPTELSPLMDEMAAFKIMVESPKRVSDLWVVRPLAKSRKRKIAKAIDDAQRAINLAKYIVRGWAFDKAARDNPNGGAK